jgi:integrase
MRKRVHVTLRAMLNYAVETKAIAVSPLATIKQDVPRYRRKPIHPLSDAEVTRLLKAAKGDRLEAMFHLALDSGARQGELFALHWDDTDLTKASVRIWRAASETKVDGVSIGPLKTDNAARSIPITKTTVTALKRRKAIAAQEGLSESPTSFLARKATF